MRGGDLGNSVTNHFPSFCLRHSNEGSRAACSRSFRVGGIDVSCFVGFMEQTVCHYMEEVMPRSDRAIFEEKQHGSRVEVAPSVSGSAARADPDDETLGGMLPQPQSPRGN